MNRLQVISRCRANYQQSRWDEAAVLYGLFTAEEWTDQENIRNSASAKQDDKFSMLRKQVVRLLENTGTQKLVLPLETWQCLHDALNAGAMRHNCHRMVSKFEYTRTKDNTPWDIDACKVSQTTGLDFPRFLWSGSSSNHVPLAKLHAEQLDPEQRQAYAENRLNKLMQEPCTRDCSKQQSPCRVKQELSAALSRPLGVGLRKAVDGCWGGL